MITIPCPSRGGGGGGHACFTIPFKCPICLVEPPGGVWCVGFIQRPIPCYRHQAPCAAKLGTRVSILSFDIGGNNCHIPAL